MPEKFILALDQGTTSSRAILFDHSGNMKGIAQKEFRQYYPQPGWVEHDAEEIWSSQFSVVAELLAKKNVSASQVAAIGITNQRETCLLWDRSTGKPLGKAIVWQDRRTAAFCDELREKGLTEMIQQKTGLIPDAYFSGSKLRWMLDHYEGASEKAARGELAFGTVDSWLVWKLTGGRLHITDVSNASRTMLLNIHSANWDPDLLDLFGVPRSILPEVRPSSQVYGYSTTLLNIAEGIPIAGMAGDQQAALFGQMCVAPGMVKNTYGTGCFMLMNTGTNAVRSGNNLLTTIAWKINDRIEYALEGSIFIAGAVVQWLRDGMGLISTAPEVEQLAGSVPDTGGIFMVPAFAGLGAPHWDQYARGTIFGLTRGATKAHLARAALESIAFQTYDVLRSMEADSGISIRELRVDGGATANNLLMQFQSDLLGTPVIRPRIYETTALGAAYLAGLATGFWSSVDEVSRQWQVDRQFSPSMNDAQRKTLLRGWERAVRASIEWAKDRSESV